MEKGYTAEISRRMRLNIEREVIFMKLRNSFALVLALMLVLLCGSALAETAFPIADPPIQVRIFDKQNSIHPDYENIFALKRYEEMTGIQVEWINTPSEVLSEKLNLTLASGDLPDAFLKCKISSADLQTYGDAGDFMDLAPLLPEYAPNFWAYAQANPDVLASITSPDGKIYSIPAACDAVSTRIALKWFFNQDWLDAVGMEQPTTLDELYDVLVAFKEQDPNGNGVADEIPLSTSTTNLYRTFSGMFGLMNRGVHFDEYDVDPQTGAVRHIKTTDEWRQLITFLHKLYAEGLLDQECITYSDTYGTGLTAQDKLGVYVSTNLALLTQEAAAHFAPIGEAIEGPNGDKLWSAIRSHLHSVGAFVLSSDTPYAKELLRWIDYFWTDEGILFYHYGVVGETCVANEDGSYSYTDEVLAPMDEGKSYDEAVASVTPFGGGNNPTIMKYPYFSGMELTPIPMEAADNLYPYTPEEVWPFFTYTTEENDIITTVGSDLNSYVKKTNAKFLTGELELTDENWNAYVEQVQKMGLDEVLEVMQAAYARAQNLILTR